MHPLNHWSPRTPRYAPEPLEPRTLLAAGALDTTFDGDGILLTPFHATVGLHAEVDELVVLPDGRVVAAAGGFDFGQPQFATVARYNLDGSLDQTFGTGGKVLTPEFMGVNSLFALPGDGLLLIGAALVARYTSTGALDPAFDGDGVARLALTNGAFNATGGLQSDGKIILAGTVNLGQAADIYIARMNADGTPDLTFGDPANGRPGLTILDLGLFEGVTDLAVAADDGILLLNSDVDGPLLTRLTRDGVLDTTFGGGDGTVSTRMFRAEDRFGAITVHAGKTLIAGFHYDPEARDGYNVVARYNNDGSLDVTFDGDGRLVVPDNGEFGTLRIRDHLGMAMDEQGNVLLAGAVYVGRGLRAGVQRYNLEGSSDTTFGTAGTATLRPESPIPWAGAVAVTADGRIVLGGGSFMDGARVFGVAQLHADGRLDSTFGNDGDVTTSFAVHATSASATVNAAVQLPDGDLLATTTYRMGTSDSDAGATRMNPNGSYDLTFGDGGEASVGARRSDSEATVDVERLADGRILVLTSRDLRLFSASGFADLSFGSGGRAAFPITVQSSGVVVGTDMAVNVDGTITVVGYFAWYDAPASEKHGFITRFNSDGTSDASFVGGYTTWRDSGSSYASEVLPLDDGRVVLASREISTRGPGYLRRFLRDGRLDVTFGPERTGRVTVDDRMIRARLQPDGKIITAGSVGPRESQLDLSARRFNADGSVDATFGTDGLVVFDFGEVEAASGIALQPDGAIVIGGDDGMLGPIGQRTTNQFFLVRLTPAGQLDATFGNGGIVRTPLPGFVQMNGLLRQADGKIVAYGTADRKIAVARYHMDDAPRVAAIFVAGSSWSPAFRAAAGAAAGFVVPQAAAPRPLPWANLDTVSVKFDRTVAVERDDLRVRGRSVAGYPVADFSYDPVTSTATWTLGRTVPADSLTVELEGGPAALRQRVDVLPGDANGDGAVLADDLAGVKARFFRSARSPGTGTNAYSVVHDLDGSGVILADDFAAAKARLFDVLPGASPAPLNRPDPVTRQVLGSAATEP